MYCKRLLKDFILKLLSFSFVAVSCNTSGPIGLFSKKSPHDIYADKIRSAGLSGTALGKQWFAAAEQSLASPLSVNLPYSEWGYFPADAPKAVGIIFRAKRGEKLIIKLSKKPSADFVVFLDLCQTTGSSDARPKVVLSVDTTSTVTYDVDKETTYTLRLQPELLKGGEYNLSISTGPTLAFPVTPKVKSTIGSFWGVGRDGGTRKHEGIDIFAPKGTALVAAADGVVTRVEQNQLGGKVVFLSPYNKDYSLYYAHLDKQIAQPGQRVKTGDTLGLMGNTGNARTTDPHLHFGIYTYRGAVDPLPFVDRLIKKPEEIVGRLDYLDKWARNLKSVNLINKSFLEGNGIKSLDLNTLFKVQAATTSGYRVVLPDGEKGYIGSSNVSLAEAPIKRINLKNKVPLLDEPTVVAARKAILPTGQKVDVLGSYKDFYFVAGNNYSGWINRKFI